MFTKEKIIRATYFQLLLILALVMLTITISKYFKYLLGVVFLNMAALFFKFISLNSKRNDDEIEPKGDVKLTFKSQKKLEKKKAMIRRRLT